MTSMSRGRLAVAMALCVMIAMQSTVRCAAEPRRTEEGTCRSVGGLKFDPTMRSMQRSKGLEVCSQYRKNTCCNETHMMPLRMKIREPVVAGFNPVCQRITEEMACSACHPFVGTAKMKNVCPRLCNDWYRACQREYYSFSGAGSLTPCYGNALVCSPLSEIAGSGAEFCEKMGFHVGSDDDSEGDDCFDGSVPRRLGDAEPSEPWQVWLQRYCAVLKILTRVTSSQVSFPFVGVDCRTDCLDEQSRNPSGLFILVIFLPVVVLYVSYERSSRRRTGATLTIEEVRAMQQAQYGLGSAGGQDMDGYSTDSSLSGDEKEERDDEQPHEEDDDGWVTALPLQAALLNATTARNIRPDQNAE
ncbi:hypothetical protein PINS_up020068 [Pythium insidiosum]|nr:hypothetical protein PINS_up020068 [Pythium insidiosum]